MRFFSLLLAGLLASASPAGAAGEAGKGLLQAAASGRRAAAAAPEGAYSMAKAGFGEGVGKDSPGPLYADEEGDGDKKVEKKEEGDAGVDMSAAGGAIAGVVAGALIGFAVAGPLGALLGAAVGLMAGAAACGAGPG